MNLVTIKFKNTFAKTYDIVLSNLKACAKEYLLKYYSANNLNIRLERERLKTAELYINKTYSVSINIVSLLIYLFNNLKYDEKHLNIIIDDNMALNGIPLTILYKIITYGNTEVKGSNIIEECLSNGFKHYIVKSFILD
jgi:hypothetical protein